MTVAIAAIVPGKTQIVTVCDARLSYGEAIPAADEATLKNRKFARRWATLFAADDATAFLPVVNKMVKALNAVAGKDEIKNHDFQRDEIADAARSAYESEFTDRFFRENLSRFGFADISDFRRTGFSEMGRDLYHQYAMSLAKFDLGLELLIYGFGEKGNPSIFEVANPGKIISHTLRGFAAVGSGSLMAIAALNRRPLDRDLSGTIYRLLDAKFSSETARDVGKRTYVITLAPNGKHGWMNPNEVDDLRTIWARELSRPHPQRALDLIESSGVVTALSDERIAEQQDEGTSNTSE